MPHSPSVTPPKPLSLQGDKAKNFEVFSQSWRDYCSAIGMDQWPLECNSAKVTLLLAFSGDPIKSYPFTAKELESPENALQAIKAKVIDKRKVVADVSRFLQAKQKPDETIDAYVAFLERLAPMSQLAQMSQSDLITCKIVTSNKWKHLRTKMKANADITLEEVLDLCRADENEKLKIKKTKKSSKPSQNLLPSELAWAAQDIAEPTRTPIHFLNADFTEEQLYNWISGNFSSEQGATRTFILEVTLMVEGTKTKPIDAAWMDKCANLIFDQAISEPYCSEGYAKLAAGLSSGITGDSNLTSFRNCLSTLCQRAFEGHFTIERGLSSQDQEESEQLDEEKERKHRQVVGTVRFIGELYNEGGMLTNSNMLDAIERLIKIYGNEYDNETLECLCLLLNTIGLRMEMDHDLTKYFSKMDKIFDSMENSQMRSKARSKIQEVIILRRNGWIA